MTGFFLKKAFFDGWDNMISLIIINLGYLLVLLALYGAFSLMQIALLPAILVFILTVGLHAFYAAGVHAITSTMVKGRRGEASSFWKAIPAMWRHALLLWAAESAALTILVFVIPFYLSLHSIFPMILAVLLFWVFLTITGATLYYYPLAMRFPQDSPRKTAKKAFVIVLDNLPFSIFLSIYHLILFVLSIFLATIIPGVAGLAVSRNGAFDLLMLKYDYLEEHPEADRKHLPWDDLLFEEREKVGHRSLRSIIFPWKD